MKPRPTAPARVSRIIVAVVLMLQAVPALAAELRLLSYNIHHGEGLDRMLDLERIAVFIQKQNPDVVALQEVDQDCERTGKVKQADELARLTRCRSAFARFMNFQGGEYGMAVLTRLSLLAERRVELPAGPEPRAASVVTLQTPAGPITLANLHFCETETQRLAQAQVLDRALAGPRHPVIWLGGFNSHPGDAVMTWLARDFAVPNKQGPTNNSPADRPRMEIDYVAFQPKDAFTVKEYRVLEEKRISDHRPLRVVLAFNATAGAATSTLANFDEAAVGQPPAGWTTAITGEGTPDWRVVADATAPSPSRVLKQSGVVPKPSYPLCLLQTPALRDGFVEVKFKTVSGEIDQAAGVVWRARNPTNYYICRANALEDNVVLYKVESGKRTALDIVGRAGGYGVDTKVPPATWQTLRVEFAGPRFRVYLDGRALFAVEDRTFTEAGQLGLWTKADSVTLFDDFKYGSNE